MYRSTESFALVKTISGAIPYLEIPSSNPGDLSSADGMIFPSMRALDRATRSYPVIAVRNAFGLVSEVAIDW